jgi:hypothetical protein
MPKVDWWELKTLHPASRRVAIEVVEEDGLLLKDAYLAIARLISQKVKPREAYAVRLTRDSGGPEVHCAFAEPEEADRFDEAMRSSGDGLTLTPKAYARLLEIAGKPGRSGRKRRVLT